MNPADLRALLLRELKRLAPECDLDTLSPKARLREELDLDSVDFLNFVLALHRGLGVEVPEADYRVLATLEGCEAYLQGRLAEGPKA